MRSLRQVLFGTFNSVYFLTEADKAFIASFGTPSKPVGLGEFLRFWNSLDEGEKLHVMLNYDPNWTVGGFKE